MKRSMGKGSSSGRQQPELFIALGGSSSSASSSAGGVSGLSSSKSASSLLSSSRLKSGTSHSSSSSSSSLKSSSLSSSSLKSKTLMKSSSSSSAAKVSSSTSSSGLSAGMKRDHGALGQSSSSGSALLMKKPKLISRPGGIGAIGQELQSIGGSGTPAELDPHQLLMDICEAVSSGNNDKVGSLMAFVVKSLKNTRARPDATLCVALLYLAKTHPYIFTVKNSATALCSLLKREQGMGFKAKGNPTAPVLATNLLMAAYRNEKEWPDNFVKVYIDDALGDRVWVDHEEAKPFVSNVLTAFNSRSPSSQAASATGLIGSIGPNIAGLAASDGNNGSGSRGGSRSCSPSPQGQGGGDNGDRESVASAGAVPNQEFSLLPRFATRTKNVEQYVSELVKETMTRRQGGMENITRNFVRFLSASSGLSEVRAQGISRLENWMGNPKLGRVAAELMLNIAANVTSGSQADVDIIHSFLRMRMKTKPHVHHFLMCVLEMLQANPDNLTHVLKYTIYNELSTTRNPGNMQVIMTLFQNSPEASARILGTIFLDLLASADDFLRSLRVLLREIVRTLRHEFPFPAFAQRLLEGSGDIASLEADHRLRIFHALSDLISLILLLCISPPVRESYQAKSTSTLGNTPILNFRRIASEVQSHAMHWLFSSGIKFYEPTETDFKYALQKIFMLKEPEHYLKVEGWPPEQERGLLLRIVQEVPVTETTLTRLLVLGLTESYPISFKDVADIAFDLVKRSTSLSILDGNPVLKFENTDILGAIFTLAHFLPNEMKNGSANVSLPSGYTPPRLADSVIYWKVWTMILLLTAHNPLEFGPLAMQKFPILHSLIEMCIVNEFQYPVASLLSPERADELRAEEHRRTRDEKAAIAEYESFLLDPRPDGLPVVTLLDPTGPARRPPSEVLADLSMLNRILKIGHLLCRSRDPDFLIHILDTQDPRRAMSWLIDLVRSSKGHLESLPVQCLCTCLIHHLRDEVGSEEIRHELVQFLRGRLHEAASLTRSRATESSAETDAVPDDPMIVSSGEILDYFFKKLSAEERDVRAEAVTTLQLLITDTSVEGVGPDWLNAVSSSGWLRSFKYIRPLFVECIRNACLVETSLPRLESYILFLHGNSPDDSLTALALDLAQVLVDRTTITSALLPGNGKTLQCLLKIFWRQLQFARYTGALSTEPNDPAVEDWVTVGWSDGSVASLPLSVIHATVILLTFGPPRTSQQEAGGTGRERKDFSRLLSTWFPLPQAAWLGTGEPVPALVPDWLKLRMIKSEVSVLVDEALLNLGPAELVLFVQSFGIPVSSMNKVLWALDSCSPASLKDHIQNVPYLIQVIDVQRRRGATGGVHFEKCLGGDRSRTRRGPTGVSGGAHIPLDAAPTPQAYRRTPDFVPKEALQSYLFCIYGLDHSRPPQPLSLRLDLTRKLMHTLRAERSCGPMTKVFLEQLTLLCKSSKGREIMTAVHEQEQESCALFKVIFGGGSRCKSTEDLAGPLPSLLIRHSPCTRLSSLLRALFSTSPLPPLPSPAVAIRPSDLSDPRLCLKSSSPRDREKLLRQLVTRALEEGMDCRPIVGAIADMLLQDDGSTAGLLMDWIQELDLGLLSCKMPDSGTSAGSSATATGSSSASSSVMTINIGSRGFNESLQLRVLFSGKAPYLLSLLTHRASWNTIQEVIEKVLGKENFHRSSSINPTAVLNFLEACLRNPKLWQGRDKDSLKSRLPKEDALRLSEDKILRVAEFVMKENHLDRRLPLLLEVCADDPGRLSALRSHLRKNPGDGVANQLWKKLYVRCPGMSSGIECPLDRVTHCLLTSLASSTGKGKGKEGLRSMEELELCCRKVASSHPTLFARQLPLMTVILQGRANMEFPLFRSRFHLYFFQCILGILDLLVPECFEAEYATALADLIHSFGDIVARYGVAYRGEMGSFVDQLMTFLCRFATICPSRGVKELQKFDMLFPRLLDAYRGMASLQEAGEYLSRSAEPHERYNEVYQQSRGAKGNIVLPAFMSSTGTVPDSTLLVFRKRLSAAADFDEETVFPILQELESLSSRRLQVLNTVLPELSAVIHSRRENVRRLAFALVLKCLKNDPREGPRVVDDYVQSLESPATPEERQDALEKLPEMVILLQEYAVRILGVVHRISIKERVWTESFFQETLRLMYKQIGV